MARIFDGFGARPFAQAEYLIDHATAPRATGRLVVVQIVQSIKAIIVCLCRRSRGVNSPGLLRRATAFARRGRFRVGYAEAREARTGLQQRADAAGHAEGFRVAFA